MITERPLYERIALEVELDPDVTRTVEADLTGVTVRRGGRREGLGLRTDVGLMTFRLHNAEDPMDGGALRPGQTVRLMDREQTYAADFASTVDGWAASTDAGGPIVNRSNTPGRGGLNGHLSVTTFRPAANVRQAERSVTGLTVGRAYTFSVWAIASSTSQSPTAYLYTSSSEADAHTTLNGATWTQLTHTFTATTPTATLYIARGATTGSTSASSIRVDDVTLTREPAHLFTGRIAHLRSTYPMDKATGRSRAVTEVTVADAVQVHGSTMRYGVDLGGAEFETFEARIQRLAASSNAPIEAPVPGAPREVYAL